MDSMELTVWDDSSLLGSDAVCSTYCAVHIYSMSFATLPGKDESLMLTSTLQV